MAFEEKKCSALSSTTKIRKGRPNFLFLTDGSLVSTTRNSTIILMPAILDSVKNHVEKLDEMIMFCYHQVADIVKE